MPPAPAPAPAPRTSAPASGPTSGPAKALAKLGLTTPMALALHLPLRWVDETRLTAVAQLRVGEVAQVEGVIAERRQEAAPRRGLKARLRDDAGGQLALRWLTSYPSQAQQVAPGRRVRVLGEVRGGLFGCEMVHPQVRAVEGDAPPPLPTALTPVYPTTAALPQAYLRKAVASGLQRADLRECLPPTALPRGLPTLAEALALLHHPPPHQPLAALEDRSHPAWQRLKYEELLAQQLAQAQTRRLRAAQRAWPLDAAANPLPLRLLEQLPFALTAAQQRVCGEIAADLARSHPMHRLLQGDVGAGKTVVAAWAALLAIGAGTQCALMAPTELLAEQHFGKVAQWLAPLGIEVAWLSGSRKGKARAQALARIAQGAAQLVIGTHAVIQADVAFARLGLAIVDEQHRFGVAQRLALRAEQGDGVVPHLLMMSATPIPRTLAMSHFADVDVSTIDELPPGRTPIVTRVFSQAKRGAVVERVAAHLASGQQAYWVCPLIEESEELDLRSAQESHAELSAALAPRRIGLLHGRLKAAEKSEVMAAFVARELDLLVATTVIEVGVDVPNATLMVIDHAERFGLAQLHQLRGRVGRGELASVCVLLHGQPLGEVATARLQAMARSTDGFAIAERDLALRGPGDVLGERQSGHQLLRFADPQADAALLEQAQAAAQWLLRHDPAAARVHVQRWLGDARDWLSA